MWSVKSAVWLTALTLAAALPRPSSAVEIEFSLSDADILPGEMFQVDVIATDLFAGRDGDELIGFGFDAALDPSIVEFQNFTLGGSFNDAGSFFSTGAGFFVGFPALGTIPDPGSPLDEPLVTLFFRAVAPGATTLALTGDPTAPLATTGFFYLSGNDAAIDASVPLGVGVVVPEPGALSLLALGLGLIGLGLRRSASQQRAANAREPSQGS